jgi:hypothetical protein
MRKMITLIAAAALVASPFAFAEDATNNPNDVMQTVPGQQVADAGMTNTTTADAAPASSDPSAAAAPMSEPAKPMHHKHHHKKHHHKHHHKMSEAPSSDTHMSKEEPSTTGSGTDMSAPAAAPTGQ